MYNFYPIKEIGYYSFIIRHITVEFCDINGHKSSCINGHKRPKVVTYRIRFFSDICVIKTG